MVCNICGINEATIHLTEIVSSEMVEIHLCESCAQEKGTDFKTHFQLGGLITGISEPVKSPKISERRASSKCPECALTYEEFGKSGRLGCPHCYVAFSKLLMPLIKRVQRSTTHVGKKPSRIELTVSVTHDLRVLHERLKKSIQMEAFEEAAHLRDEIRQVEEKGKKPRKEAK